MSKRFANIRFITSFILLILVAVIGLIQYNRILREKLLESTEVTLSEIAEQNRFNFDSEIKAELTSINTLASALPFLDKTEEKVVTFLKNTLSKTKFDNMAIVNLNGVGVADTGGRVNVVDHSCFKRAVKGETVFEESQELLLQDGEIIHLAAPIREGNTITGVIICTYDINKLDKLLLPSFEGKGYAFVVNRDGNIIASTNNDYVLADEENLFEFLKKATFKNENGYKDMFEDVKNGNKGKMVYSIQGQERHATYVPLDTNGWYIFFAIPDEVVSSNIIYIMKITLMFTGTIVLGFLICIVYIISAERKAYSEREKFTKQLFEAAYYDEMTGLPNLNKFKEDALEIIKRNSERSYVVVKIDIINFKMINEMFGLEVGNAVVCKVGEFIKKTIGCNNYGDIGTVARINADEFIILDEGELVEQTNEKRTLFENEINKDLYTLLGSYKVEFRYGRYFVEEGESDIDQIIENVNLAHRTAKSVKNGKMHDYDKEFKEKLVRETIMENMAEKALQNREFKLYLQPKYKLSNEKIVGAEALVRWETQDGRMILPNDFIPLFERNGFIVKLDFYMLERVCEQLRKWKLEGKKLHCISVNFSRRHLQNKMLVESIDKIAQKYDVDRSLIEIELTESVIFDNESVLTELLNKLHKAGFTLSMDDFGTGYSSLGLLKSLPVDVIKLDRSFFVDGCREIRAKTVVESVMNMAKGLNIKTVAEGVEDKEMIEFLRSLGCDMVQGYYYAKPMPAEEMETS